jgi:hypothetical protein
MDNQTLLNGWGSMKKFSVILVSLFLTVSTLPGIGCRKSEKPAETIATFEARLPETPTPTPGVKKKSTEIAQSQAAEQTEPGAEKKSIKSAGPELPAAKSPKPSVEKKSKEPVRLESTPSGEGERKITERGIYFDRYTEVTGMVPGAAEGLIHTGRESRAWYERSRVSSPLNDKELQAINDTLAKSEVQNACSIADSIFPDNPEKTITLSDLKEKGFIPSESIILTIDNGTKESLRISAKHNKGAKLYVTDSDCHIREELQH